MTAARRTVTRQEALDEWSRVTGFEFRIPPGQQARAQRQVNREFLEETYFLIPDNDGEAHRCIDILRAVNAPHLRVSEQEWGATLQLEGLDPVELARELHSKGVRRVAILEIPGAEFEQALRNEGLEVMILDHHDYDTVRRAHPESSLEQLMKAIHWPPSRTDLALAVNDRSYIPGLKAMGLAEDEIRGIRAYDLLTQGKRPSDLEESYRQARELLPNLPRLVTDRGLEVFILKEIGELENYVKQELSIRSPDGLVNTLTLDARKVGFSGAPEIVDRLYGFDYTALGYRPGSFARWAGGDPKASRYFGFKPKEAPRDAVELLPTQVTSRIWKIVESS